MLYKSNERIKITLNEDFLSRVDFMRAVVRYLTRHNKECKILDLYYLSINNRKYYLRDQNLTPEGAKFIRNAILIPVEE
ncbi:branched-chain amino acid ABC transporter substrate-binding protein [Clostridium sp. LIBA-8841]|uniref:branched-chain amino acid ABC transporter substrate-binding protein n=1 Tax=Clostridium sp. LIBA-8841 TaxID=2987530 RepID=UPI002AC610F0|nr:branched-chain amino acid ABC transporter substrate-binding protein [Clostridium sp. LIBA-8841]MDZ5253559.1 branched-chain amino acid ABC transporter substrate-binding protein [Clostridium sp. LIBA-8841]